MAVRTRLSRLTYGLLAVVAALVALWVSAFWGLGAFTALPGCPWPNDPLIAARDGVYLVATTVVAGLSWLTAVSLLRVSSGLRAPGARIWRATAATFAALTLAVCGVALAVEPSSSTPTLERCLGVQLH